MRKQHHSHGGLHDKTIFRIIITDKHKKAWMKAVFNPAQPTGKGEGHNYGEDIL